MNECHWGPFQSPTLPKHLRVVWHREKSAKLLATWVRVSVLSLTGDVTLGKSQSL